jgi:DDE_Tnp_1-associated/Transposase DDE domain
MAVRMNRRLFGMLSKRLDEAGLDEIADERDDRGKRWQLGALLRAALGGMLAGAKSVAEVETLSERLSRPMRRLLGVRRRLPDTTLRSALCTVEPDRLRKPLHALVKKAQRRKALESGELPFGVVSLDGKAFSIPSCDDWVAQRQTQSEDGALVGVVRTVTATLTSCDARPIIDVTPIPAPTNEMGIFEHALTSLCAAYKGSELFQLVTYDAGACSARNATLVREHNLHYLFGLTASQPTLFEDAKRWLGPKKADDADISSRDFDRGTLIVRRLFIGKVTDDYDGWPHLRTVLRIQTDVFDCKSGQELSSDERYLVSSLPSVRLTPQHWLLVIRRHWGVETSHQILDTAFAEDDHPWIEANPRAALVVALLRRIAYTLLALFRSVTQRSDERRAVPWKALMSELAFALVTTTDDELRERRRSRLC